MAELGRMITAMVTPFNTRGEVDHKQAQRLARALIGSGSDGLVVTGTTGERPTLTDEEQLKLFATVREAIGKKGTIIAGTGGNCTRESIAMTGKAERLGVDGALLIVPYYNKPTQEGMYQHFKAIAESTSLPCILYNVPARTVTNLAPETVIRLSGVKNIVGIKEASGNLEQIAKIIHGVRKGFLVWSGNDSDTFPVMAMGGHGVISVASHLVGKQIHEMIQLTLKGKTKEAAAIHLDLLPLINALFIVSNPIPVKYALNHVGFRVGKPRLPLTEPDDKSRAVIEAALKNYRIDLPI
ncbi:MAG: 4-hydroxy-tetrahydrodipicolinate synthase [Dehalococcoidia bacterium]|nr:4-hydroxy-tetrahydrodipicolinate synthase [Dehalococcoidia bacterium]